MTVTQTTAPQYRNYINGEWKDAASGNTVASLNPANRHDVVGIVPNSGREDLDAAVAAANAAAKAWSRMAGPARGQLLYKAANILESRLDDIAATMTREMGKTFGEAKGETARGVALLRYYAGEGSRKIGDVIPASDASGLMFTIRVPLGVVGVITPWNFPVAIPMWKIAPALAYGNTVVWKPATETAVTAAKLAEVFHEAGFPPGVVNLVIGSGSVVGQGIAEHPGIHGISFTGSNPVGKRISQAALARGAKYQLEMGGKNPVIVARDADLDLAVNATISGAFRSTGQKCTATSRVIVEKDIYPAFREKLLEKTRTLRIGDGLDESTWLGPCASESQMETVLSYIQKGVEEGATLLCGGRRLTEGRLADGFFVEPTVFENVTPDMAIFREEIFGPVIALVQAENLEEAIRLANDSEYGLSASIFTRDIGNVLAFIRDMDAGLVRVNEETAGVELQAPFGGMKQSSSHSREQGTAAIEFYTSVKTVFIKG
ncbi:MAG: aldehyde dehydrogenase [Paenibacillaceae bacterium ZCTH02-B3]|nr:MAG: aldehyde dehydrogenase [Paenibacillaceae bacterium ZCTH02-B3]